MNPSLEEKERLERTHAQVSDRPSVDALEQDSREKGNLGANSEQQDDEFHVGDKHDAPMPGRGQEDTTLMDRFPKRRKLEEETAGISSHSLGQVVKADLHNQRSETAGPAMAPATNSLFLHRQSHQLGQLPSSLPNMNAIAGELRISTLLLCCQARYSVACFVPRPIARPKHFPCDDDRNELFDRMEASSEHI